MTNKKTYSSKTKGKVAIATIKGDKTLAEISSLYNVSPKRACVWKKQLLEQVNLVYENGNGNQRIELEYENKISGLYRKIGELSIENEYLKKKLN
jgi:transposase